MRHRSLTHCWTDQGKETTECCQADNCRRRVITVGTAYTAQYRPIPPNTAQYRPIPPNTAQYRPIPPNTAQYRPIPPNTAKYRQIPPNTAKYRQIPPNTAKYRQIPPNTAKYRQIPPNTAKYYVFGGIWRYIITSSVIILYNINITFIKNIGILYGSRAPIMWVIFRDALEGPLDHFRHI